MSTRLLLLGTARQGIASALVVGERVYLVDFGQGACRQLTLARLPEVTPSRTLAGVTAGFITHLHADHTMDLANFFLCGANQGWPRDRVVEIWGPGERPRGAPEAPEPPEMAETPEPDPATTPDGCCSAAEAPVPGTAGFVTALLAAFQANTYDRIAHEGGRDPAETVTGRDVPLPPGVTPAVIAELGAGAALDPWPVYEDDRVRVTATLVAHGRIFPALAYRFDTDDGSVTFSGDTSSSAGLIRLAEATDILVHEAIDTTFADFAFGPPPHTAAQRAAVATVLGKHTPVTSVGATADAAGARALVLSHLVPASAPDARWEQASHGYRGRCLVGQDLLELTVPAAARP